MQSLPAFNFPEGEILLINKPLGWTSFDVVNKVRNVIRVQLGIKKIKVGHAGTLDPLATGLLILCTGKFTKKINQFQNLDKEYTGTMVLGATTPSYDLETKPNVQFDVSGITDKDILQTVNKFIGEIEQKPPAHSAVKVDGQAAYIKARQGEEVKTKTRSVNIYEFEIVNIHLPADQVEMPEIQFRVKCSKGTYIRSLVNDFGMALQNGAYLKELCRTEIGEYKLENAISLEDFSTLLGKKEVIS